MPAQLIHGLACVLQPSGRRRVRHAVVLALASVAYTLLTAIVPAAAGGVPFVDYCQLFNTTGTLQDEDTINGSNFLRNRHLHIAFTPWSPFINVDEEGGITGGHDLELLTEISRRAGFTFTKHLLIKLDNESTWDDTLTRGGEAYDLLGQWWVDTSFRRSNGVAIGKHVVDTSMIMITSKSASSTKTVTQSLLTVLSPFSTMLWITIVLLILGASLFMWFLERGENYIEFAPSDAWYINVLHSVYLGFSSLTGAAYHSPQTPMGKVFSVGFSFAILITVAAYTANLANYLVSQSTANTTFNSLDDVLRANEVCCLLDGYGAGLGAEYSKLRTYEVYGVNEMYTAIKAGHCVAGVAGLAELQLLIAGSGDCTLGLAGQFLSRSGGGFAAGSTACKPMIVTVLDAWLVRLEEEGFVQALWANYTSAGGSTCSSSSSASTAVGSTAMSVVDFGGVIVIVAIFASLTFVGSLFFRSRLWRVRSRVVQVKNLAQETSRFAMKRAPSAWSAVKEKAVKPWSARSPETSVPMGGASPIAAVRFQDVVQQAGITHAQAWAPAEEDTRVDDMA